jgi:hypothetical protein
MAVDLAEVARLTEMANTLPDAGDCAQLNTVAEIIAYIVACARSEGLDEIDSVELVLTAALPSRKNLFEARRTLRALGYTNIADLLLRLARKARKTRKPAERPHTRSSAVWATARKS